MWTTLAAMSSADEVAALEGRCIIGNARSGELLTLDPTTSPAPAALLGAGWPGVSTLAGLPDSSALLMIDSAGVLWRVDLSSPTPATAIVRASQLGQAAQLSVPTLETAYLLGRADPGPQQRLPSRLG